MSLHATTWGSLKLTARLIRGRATLPISLLSSVLRGSAVSLRPYSSIISFSLFVCSGSILHPTRKLSDSTVLTLSATASAKRGTMSKTSSQRGHISSFSKTSPLSARAALIICPRRSSVRFSPSLANILPRQWSHNPICARPLPLSRMPDIHSSMRVPQRSNPISAILSLGRWDSR